jgi:hypothetical protein
MNENIDPQDQSGLEKVNAKVDLADVRFVYANPLLCFILIFCVCFTIATLFQDVVRLLWGQEAIGNKGSSPGIQAFMLSIIFTWMFRRGSKRAIEKEEATAKSIG